MTRAKAKELAIESVQAGYCRNFGIPTKYKDFIKVCELRDGRLVVRVDVGSLTPDEGLEVIKYYKEHVQDKVFDKMGSFNLNLTRRTT